MKTILMLMAMYDSKPIIPVETVRADYFPHLTLDEFLRQIGSKSIKIPVVRATTSQKSAKGVHLQDLADYLDGRRAAAQKELEQMTR